MLVSLHGRHHALGLLTAFCQEPGTACGGKPRQSGRGSQPSGGPNLLGVSSSHFLRGARSATSVSRTTLSRYVRNLRSRTLDNRSALKTTPLVPSQRAER